MEALIQAELFILEVVEGVVLKQVVSVQEETVLILLYLDQMSLMLGVVEVAEDSIALLEAQEV